MVKVVPFADLAGKLPLGTRELASTSSVVPASRAIANESGPGRLPTGWKKGLGGSKE